MSSFSHTSNNEEENSRAQHPDTFDFRGGTSGGAGSTGQNPVASGGSAEGGENDYPDQDPSDRAPERKVLYSHLKDMAIDALELSREKNQEAIAESIRGVLSAYDMQAETADVLASMVWAAYSCAGESKDDMAVFLAYSCFTDAQIVRIIGLARSK